MNVLVRPGLSLAEFLAWEREQPQRYEFDGTQPVPMTGGTVAHAWIVRRLIEALIKGLDPEFQWFAGDLKVLTAGRVRYPDILVVLGLPMLKTDTVEPIAVFEVLSPSTALTDLRVKPQDYAASDAIQVYVILPQDGPDGALVLRRSTGWEAESVAGVVDLPEIGMTLDLAVLYPRSMVEGVGFEPT